MVEEVIAHRLAAATAVTAFVGPRIYQLKLRQGSPMPAVRVQVISDVPDYHNRGDVNLSAMRIQVDCYGHQAATPTLTDPYAAVQSLAAAVNDALTGEPFTIGDQRVVGVFREDLAVTTEEDELKLIRVRQDFRVRAKTV